MNTWYKIGGANLSFNSRPLTFTISTTDAQPYTIFFDDGGQGTYNSGEKSVYMYAGGSSHSSFSFYEPLRIKDFSTTDELYIDNKNIGWLNIQNITVSTGNQATKGDMTGVSLLTSLNTLFLNSNGFTGNMTGVSSLTSLNYLYLNGSEFTGDMSGVSSLTSLTNLQLIGNSFTGNMTDVSSLALLTNLRLTGNGFTGNMTGTSSLTSLTILYLTGNRFTGNMTGSSSLTSLTYLYLNANGFTGNMSGVSSLTSLTTLYLNANGFTGNMSGVSSLISLTTLYLISNGFTGNMSGVSYLTSLKALYLNSIGFTYTYTTLTANLGTLFFRLKAGELYNPTNVDQLFIDLNISTTNKTGSFDIRSSGAASPTAASLNARNSLISKGRNILTN